MAGKCPHPGCTVDPQKPERRSVLLSDGGVTSAWLVVRGPHAAAYAMEIKMLAAFGRKPKRRHA